MAMGRDRATGWQHAKLSGHENESDVEQLFNDDNFKVAFSKRLGIGEIASATVGGLRETDVISVFGDKTKSKTDLTIVLKDGNTVNISIKKSWGGQVYLIGVDRFIAGFEKHFDKEIPAQIKELLYIYFYGSPKTDSLLNDAKVIANETAALVSYQKKHNRLVWTSLYNWDKSKADSLLQWFKDNISEIAEYCFARGLAKDKKDWAQYVGTSTSSERMILMKYSPFQISSRRCHHISMKFVRVLRTVAPQHNSRLASFNGINRKCNSITLLRSCQNS